MKITIDGRDIDVTPVRVKDLPRFLRAVEPIASALAGGDVMAALSSHAENVIEAAAIGAGVERDWLDQQTPDVLAEILGAVIEVNADFFVRRLAPAIERASGAIARSMQTNSAASGSSHSVQ